ncbi:hypothetical protein [Deinococcus planocerae]|uniref:hypothetical protein n=1 Tax=Deinococcus planocerae TaxID=1737569 RepID=UPI000C7ECAEC|nr:hypothetical protein [Deinococcus planocerae]
MTSPARRQARTTLALTALTGLSAALAGTAPAQPGPAWNAARLSTATYVILDPRIEGNPNVLNPEQRAGILGAMRRDTGGAIKRRYPGATVAADPATPGAVRVTPVLVAPGALVPWAKLSARLDFDLPGGERVSLNDSFGLLVLWQYQAEAANYVYGELVKRLP